MWLVRRPFTCHQLGIFKAGRDVLDQMPGDLYELAHKLSELRSIFRVIALRPTGQREPGQYLSRANCRAPDRPWSPT